MYKNRVEQLRRLQMIDFALQEAALFLNSHPDDENALQYYKKFQQFRKQAACDYQECFGPLTNRDNNANTWQYIDGPWPWESEA